MTDDSEKSQASRSPLRGHIHHPLRGLASEGAERAVRQALEGLPGILKIEVSSGMAMAEVLFDEAVVSAEDVRARLELAGRQSPKSAQTDIS